jgi:single-strand DNA-binding protein
VRGIKDTSRQGRWHNARFKALAEEVGIEVTKDPRIGWSPTTLTDATREEYTDTIATLGDALHLFRSAEIAGGKTNNPTSDGATSHDPRDQQRTKENTAMGTTSVHFSGNLTAEPELRFATSGKAVTKLRVAVQSRRPKADGTGWEDGPATFHNVTVWGTPAAHAAESLARGDRVVVIGRLEQRSYQTDNGEARTTWDVTAEEIGASLRYATARPTKATRATGSQETEEEPAVL